MSHIDFFSIVIESCLVNCSVDLTFNWSYDDFEKNSQPESRIAKTFPFLAGSEWTFKVTKDNKAAFLETFSHSFKSVDFCHFIIKHGDKEIGKCYDYADSNFLNPKFFDAELLASKLSDEEIEIIYSED